MTNRLSTVDEITAFLLVIANGHRLAVLHKLQDGEMAVSEIVAEVGISHSALSQHLAKLRAGGLVKTRREGLAVFYSIKSVKVHQILDALAEIFDLPVAREEDLSLLS